MKNRGLLVVLLALLLAHPVLGQTADEESLRAELAAVFNALADGNFDYFTTHYVDDATRIHMTGGVDIGWDETKATFLEQGMESGWRFKASGLDVSDIRIFDDVAITAGTGSAVQSMPGVEDETLQFRFTYVWVKRGGRWLEAHHHVSALE